MTKIADILAQRDVAIGILTKSQKAANKAKREGAAGMVAVVNALAAQKAAIAAQAFEGALNDPAMTAALAKLRAITDDMNEVASKMRSATTIIANIDALLTTANKVIPVLTGTRRGGGSA